MNRQLNTTIAAMLSAADEISRLKLHLAPDDPRLEILGDIEIGTAWILKRLRSIGPSSARADAGRPLAADISMQRDSEETKDLAAAGCES